MEKAMTQLMEECASTEMLVEERETVIYRDEKNCDYVVNIENGFRDSKKGFFVEIWSDNFPRRSVTIWQLRFNNEQTRDLLFERLFNTTFKLAKKIDEKKGIITNSLLISRLKILLDSDVN